MTNDANTPAWVVGQRRPTTDFRAFPAHQGEQLLDWIDTALWSLHKLHTGDWQLDGGRDQATLDQLYAAINDVGTRLLPRLQGLQEALIRAHRQAGGSYGELATAMDVGRPTAQTRAVRVTSHREPHAFEAWASGPAPVEIRAADVRPGDTLVTAPAVEHGWRAAPPIAEWEQVTEVILWPEGTRRSCEVELAVGQGGGYPCGRDTQLTVVHRASSSAWTEGTETIDGEVLTVYRRRTGTPRETIFHWTTGFQGEGAEEPQTLYCEGSFATYRQVVDAHLRADDGAVMVLASTTPGGEPTQYVLRAHRIRWVEQIRDAE